MRTAERPSRRTQSSGVPSMNKEMIISSGEHETRVAILEDDQVVEVFIERENQRGVVGNVYKGRVNKVLPGMQSSFVDVGLERDAFLYVSEVVNAVEDVEQLEAAAEDDHDGEPAVAVALGVPPPETVAALEAVQAAEAAADSSAFALEIPPSPAIVELPDNGDLGEPLHVPSPSDTGVIPLADVP